MEDGDQIIKTIPLALVIILLFACEKAEKTEHRLFAARGEASEELPPSPKVEIDPVFRSAMTFDDLFTLDRVIKLETTEQSRIGYLKKIRYHHDRLYILDNIQNTVLVFDDKGTFLHPIGRSGEGPGEYGKAENIYIHNNDIAVVDSRGIKVLFYDLQGNFKRSITPDITDFPIYFYGNLIFRDNLLYVCDFFSYDADMPRHLVLDLTEEPAPQSSALASGCPSTTRQSARRRLTT